MRLGRAVLAVGDVLEPDVRLLQRRDERWWWWWSCERLGVLWRIEDGSPSMSSACPEARAQSAPVVSMKNSFGDS